MDDYFQVVERKKRVDVEYSVLMNDDGTVSIQVTGVSRPLTFELIFPSLESKDDYLASSRTRRVAHKLGGRLTVITPNELLSYPVSGEEQGSIQGLETSRLTRALGVSEAILHTCQPKAWEAVIAWYQRRMS